MKNFKLTKETDKFIRYENDDYIVELREGGWSFPPKRIAEELGIDRMAQFYILKVKSKKTKKSAQTRAYQDWVLKDLDRDYIHKTQFKKLIWNKID